MPWAVFLTVIVAPGITAPVGSLTVPTIRPVTAHQEGAVNTKRNRIRDLDLGSFIGSGFATWLAALSKDNGHSRCRPLIFWPFFDPRPLLPGGFRCRIKKKVSI